MNYESLQKGRGSTVLITLVVVLIITTLGMMFYPILKIELSDDRFIMKRLFGIKSSIKYDDIEEMTISYGDNIGLKEQKFNEFIWIYKKNKNEAAISIPRDRIVLEQNSNFLNSVNFLSKKVTLTICIANIYKPYINDSIIDAKIDWSDNPNIYK